MPRKGNTSRSESVIPLLPLTTTVVFPSRVVTVHISMSENLALLREYTDDDATIALGFCEPGTKDDVKAAVISRVAVLARVIDRIKLPGEGYRVTLQGLRRIEIDEILQERPFYQARVAELDERTRDPFRVNVYVQKAINLYERLASMSLRFPKELTQMLKVNIDNPSRFADLLCASVEFDYAERHRIVQAIAVDQRLQRSGVAPRSTRPGQGGPGSWKTSERRYRGIATRVLSAAADEDHPEGTRRR